MLVLGIGGSNHDFSAAVVEDGRIRVAIEDERLQGVKRGRAEWYSEPAKDAVMYCLSAQGVTVDDFDAIFCCDDLERPTTWLDWSRVTMVNHHTSHAAAAFFTSPFERSALLVVDGHGSPFGEDEAGYEVETISIGRADGMSLSVEPHQTGFQRRTSSSWRYVTTNSIGWLYKIVSQALGFDGGEQGKTMGLAAFGTPSLVDELSQFVSVEPEGRFVFDPYGGIWHWLTATLERSRSVQVRADIAYAAQAVLQRAVVAAALESYRRYPCDVLSFGGGCALNTLANSQILVETPFKHLAIFPASGDNGLSVGAALYGTHSVLEWPRPPTTDDWRSRAVYLGRDYAAEEIAAALSDARVSAARPAELEREVGEALVAGSTVAVFRGSSEIGPRALGNRSLLAMPNSERMRDHINLNIKLRESFRPLAPVVPLDDVERFFADVSESPHMLLVARVRDAYRSKLAAVTHVDGTARVQTVRDVDNEFLYRLLKLVGELTGIPVLLNTSLNFPGKPIVETPRDALDLYLASPIDVLIVGDWVARKHTPWVPRSAFSVASADPGLGAAWPCGGR